MTNLSLRRDSGFRPAFFGTITIVCFSYAMLALLLMHVLRPDYAPAIHMISEYAVGQYGWVMTTCFLAMASGCLMLLLGLARSGPGSFLAWAGTLLLTLPSVGLVISALYPMDGTGAPSTRTGEIHDISFLVNVVSIFLTTVLLSVGFGSTARWRSFQRTAVILSLLVVLAFVLQFVTIQWRTSFGLANRFFVLVLFTWFFATSMRLRRMTTQ
jgi:hypothetical membrane protein